MDRTILTLHVTWQKYYNMRTFNNPFTVGDKVLKKSMADELCKAKMGTKWTDPNTIVEDTAVAV